jgi:HK97 gp10 family phage protein
MMFEPVFVEGLDEVEIALRELPDATSRNVLKRVAKKVLQPIADRAAMLAPVDKGRLRHSINVSDKLSRRQRSQFQRTDPNDVVMFVGAGAVPQAHMQEFGTVDQEPQPFMRPAWDGGKDKVLEDIKGELWTEIEKAAKRLARKAAKQAAAGG